MLMREQTGEATDLQAGSDESGGSLWDGSDHGAAETVLQALERETRGDIQKSFLTRSRYKNTGLGVGNRSEHQGRARRHAGTATKCLYRRYRCASRGAREQGVWIHARRHWRRGSSAVSGRVLRHRVLLIGRRE